MVTTAIAAVVFVALAVLVTLGNTESFDRWFLRTLRTADGEHLAGPSFLEFFAQDLTALGSYPVLLVLTIAMVGFFAVRLEWRAAAALAVSSLSGALILQLMKPFFNRQRPDVVPHLIEVNSLSFPSGHATMSAVIYLTLGFVSASFYDDTRTRAYIVSVFSLGTFLVGTTRVALGVHYPSDVLAGWSFGLAWSLLAWMGVRWFTSWSRTNSTPHT